MNAPFDNATLLGCAWVLWLQTSVTSYGFPIGQPQTKALSAYEGKAECESEKERELKGRKVNMEFARDLAKRNNPSFDQQIIAGPSHISWSDPSGQGRTYEFQCFPDTVKP